LPNELIQNLSSNEISHMDQNLFDLSKALDTSTTNGNNVLDPVLLSKVISEQVRKMPTLRNFLKRTPWGTNIYTWDSITSDGNAMTAADGATLSYSDATFIQNQAKMSYFYYVALITNPAILAAQELIDVVSMRIGQATKAVIRNEGSVLYNGDVNNSQNPGLFSVLESSPTYSYAGNGATLSRALMSVMDNSLRGNGYEANLFVASPGAYNIISEAAFNAVRFIGTDTQAIGFSQSPTKVLTVNGIPVVMDPYAVKYNAATNVNMVGSGSVFAFPNSGVLSNAGSDFSGNNSWVAPIIKVGGSTVSNYTLTQSGSSTIATFASAPGSTPTASFEYTSENLFALSLDPADLVIAEQMGIMVEQDLGKPVLQDAIPFRVKEYSVLAVRNPLAHALASNIVLPSSYSQF